MNTEIYKLTEGSKVAIIGGGPAGCFFALYLSHYAGEAGIKPDITVFESRDFGSSGLRGCKGCAGILSSSLLSSLTEIQLALPEEVIQQRIDGYNILSRYTAITMSNPDRDAQVVSVFRGSGPRICQGLRPIGFDGWLLEETQKRGVRVEDRRIDAIQAGRPMRLSVEGEMQCYDLVVLANGVNTKPVHVEGLKYIPPKTQTMAQDELKVGTTRIHPFPDNVAHAFLIPRSGLIAGCFVPKGSFLNVSVLNKTEQPISVSEFLQNEIVQNTLPGPYERVCGCSPRVAITSARHYFADGFVAVGDAAVSRLYKDGIGSALRTAREAARTVVHHGFSRRAFGRHYQPYCRGIDRDNRWGRALFWLNDKAKDSRTFLWMQHRLIGDEQIANRGPKPFTKAVWGMFTGSYSYRSIARMTLNPTALCRLALTLLQETARSPFNRSPKPRKLHIGARKVLILGSGFVGTYVLRRLVPSLNRNENVETTMVSDENFFLFAPLLHEVAMGRIETRHIAYPIRRLHWRDRFSFLQGAVQKIDLRQRRVMTSAGPLAYDYLVLALGSEPDLSELAAAGSTVFTLNSLHDSMRIRNHIIEVFERALAENDQEKRKQLLTFVVSGGGYKGVQLITELRDFIRSTMLKLYRPLRPEDIRLILVEAEQKIVAELHTKLGAYILKQLKKMGIEVRPSSRITGVWEDHVTINGSEHVKTSTLIWVSGVVASPQIAELDVEKDGLGRVLVDAYLNIPKFPTVYAAGDCAHFKDPSTNRPIPPRAYTAVRQAETIARNILADIRGGEAKPYHYGRIPQMVSLGASRAVVRFHNMQLVGYPARLLWLAAYTLLIAGWYNRIRVLMDWLLSSIFGRDTTFLRLTKSRSPMDKAP
ncbi:MAG TPA: FAD-dependent oxidoreductase [Acidobacteriota bacterium]|nr:FAD-dependent oxidoreductase [Acidobacteriota bacterium]